MVSLGTLLNVNTPSCNAETGTDWKVKSATMSAHRSMPRFRDVLSFIINLAKIFPGELFSAYVLLGMRELEAAGSANVKRGSGAQASSVWLGPRASRPLL